MKELEEFKSVDIGDIFVALLTTEKCSILVAYDFLKDRFTLESMINGLHLKKVQLITRPQINTIKRAERIAYRVRVIRSTTLLQF